VCGGSVSRNRKYIPHRKGENMSDMKLISDAAKEVNVENHVLRYWEEELRLPIKRNELGHRYYTKEDVERFKQIKSMKEKGLQLKAIKLYLLNGKMEGVLVENTEKEEEAQREEPAERNAQELNTQQSNALQEVEKVMRPMAINIVENPTGRTEIAVENKEDKARRLQWLLQQLIRETLRENNQELCREIKESVIKELDYQFRAQEEREDERERRQVQRNEEYYKKMDQLLRNKSKRANKETVLTAEGDGLVPENKKENKKDKKKRHSIF